MKKNILFSIVVIVFVFSIFSVTNVFVKNSPYENTYLIQGQMFSIKDFSNAIKHHSKVTAKEVEQKEISQLSITNIDLKDNQLSFEATMEHGLKLESFNVSGMLFGSYKTQEGKNSTVGQLETDNHYKIMYFEIYNDNEEEYLILDNVNVHTPHLKLYVLDRNKNIHVFEGELPLEFIHINSNDFQRCDAKVDLFWSSGLFEMGTTKVLDINEEIQKIMELPYENFKGLPNFLDWNGTQIYYKKIQTGADYVECYSLPYVYGEYTNIQGGLSTWSLKFGITECCYVNGKRLDPRIKNIFRYKNVKISVERGLSTAFFRTYLIGNLQQNIRNGLGSILMKQNTISEMWDHKIQSVSYNFDQDEFYDNEHYLQWQGDIRYQGNGEPRKTDGKFKFSFDVWDLEKETAIENIKEELSFPYTADLER